MESGTKGLKRTGIRDHNPGIWSHNAWDRDQQYFSWNQGSRIKFLRVQESKFWVKIWDQLRKKTLKLGQFKRDVCDFLIFSSAAELKETCSSWAGLD